MPEHAIANRRAALLAHAMPAADREWLLAELDEGRRGVLAGLLEELRSLGIPRDPALVRQLLDEEAGGDPGRSLAALDADGVTRLIELLRSEPETVVTSFLRARAWPWRDVVVRELRSTLLRPFDAADSPVPRGLEQAIVAAVWTAVEARLRRGSERRAAIGWTKFHRRRAGA